MKPYCPVLDTAVAVCINGLHSQYGIFVSVFGTNPGFWKGYQTANCCWSHCMTLSIDQLLTNYRRKIRHQLSQEEPLRSFHYNSLTSTQYLTCTCFCIGLHRQWFSFFFFCWLWFNRTHLIITSQYFYQGIDTLDWVFPSTTAIVMYSW